MTQPNTTPSRSIHPLVRYLPLLALLVLLWPLSGQSLDVFGLEMSATVVGAVLAILGAAFGTLATRDR